MTGRERERERDFMRVVVGGCWTNHRPSPTMRMMALFFMIFSLCSAMIDATVTQARHSQKLMQMIESSEDVVLLFFSP
jgi:hypothetical protein